MTKSFRLFLFSVIVVAAFICGLPNDALPMNVGLFHLMDDESVFHHMAGFLPGADRLRLGEACNAFNAVVKGHPGGFKWEVVITDRSFADEASFARLLELLRRLNSIENNEMYLGFKCGQVIDFEQFREIVDSCSDTIRGLCMHWSSFIDHHTSHANGEGSSYFADFAGLISTLRLKNLSFSMSNVSRLALAEDVDLWGFLLRLTDLEFFQLHHVLCPPDRLTAILEKVPNPNKIRHLGLFCRGLCKSDWFGELINLESLVFHVCTGDVASRKRAITTMLSSIPFINKVKSIELQNPPETWDFLVRCGRLESLSIPVDEDGDLRPVFAQIQNPHVLRELCIYPRRGGFQGRVIRGFDFVERLDNLKCFKFVERFPYLRNQGGVEVAPVCKCEQVREMLQLIPNPALIEKLHIEPYIVEGSNFEAQVRERFPNAVIKDVLPRGHATRNLRVLIGEPTIVDRFGNVCDWVSRHIFRRN